MDFSGQNLRGHNFKGQDLTGANFSGADIRGANFTNAILVKANFNYVKAGCHPYWLPIAGLSITILVLSALSGSSIASLVSAVLVSLVTAYATYSFFSGTTVTVSLILSAVAIALLIAGCIAFVTAITILIVFTRPIYPVIFPSLIPVSLGLLTSLSVMLFGSKAGIVSSARRRVKSGFLPLFFEILKELLKFVTISTSGTNFLGADLTNASFEKANLKGTNFYAAHIKQTSWTKALGLQWARLGDTILADPSVQRLLVTGQGKGKRYVNCNFKGANLAGATLNKADFTETDFSGATLVGASLERANLTKVQALGTNFHQAILTGACLEDWNIDSTTQLEGAICEYVYLLRDQRERRPSSGVFAPGEFTKLFQEVLSTIDLIFRNGIDWKAFTYSFNKLVLDNDGTELSIQSIENKGDGVVVVRVNAPPDADKAKLHSEFNQTYEAAVKALEARYQTELKAKDDQITIYRQQSASMEEIVRLMASRPVTVEVNATAESKSMNDSTDASRKIQIGDIGGDFNASGAALNLGEVSGTVSDTINQIADTSSDLQEIKELLRQLQTAIASEPHLSGPDKVDALEQVKILAKEAQKPPQERTAWVSDRAIKFIRVSLMGLTNAARSMEQIPKLLEAIAQRMV
jgi:uncharacterized protein YjbI with pentapeptide repeats